MDSTVPTDSCSYILAGMGHEFVGPPSPEEGTLGGGEEARRPDFQLNQIRLSPVVMTGRFVIL